MKTQKFLKLSSLGNSELKGIKGGIVATPVVIDDENGPSTSLYGIPPSPLYGIEPVGFVR